MLYRQKNGGKTERSFFAIILFSSHAISNRSGSQQATSNYHFAKKIPGSPRNHHIVL